MLGIIYACTFPVQQACGLKTVNQVGRVLSVSALIIEMA
jgi:hypothetical protein